MSGHVSYYSWSCLAACLLLLSQLPVCDLAGGRKCCLLDSISNTNTLQLFLIAAPVIAAAAAVS